MKRNSLPSVTDGVPEGAKMPQTKTQPWDAVEHLETAEDMAAYMEAALEDGDALLVAAALEDIARARESVGGHGAL